MFKTKKPEPHTGIWGGAKGPTRGGKRASWWQPGGESCVTKAVTEKQIQIPDSLKVRGLTMNRIIQMEEQSEAESKATRWYLENHPEGQM